jgi:fumarate hydratase subunit alpha
MKLSERVIRRAVVDLCLKANFDLRPDVLKALKDALRRETNARAGRLIRQLLDNAKIARREKIAICQDTGLPVVYVEVGPDVELNGLRLIRWVQKGVVEGYRKGYLRPSVVADPLERGRGSSFGPVPVHISFVSRKGLRITLLPKGFGCENKTQLKMFPPTTPLSEIEVFVACVVKDAGPDACPPYVVGIGIGGAADTATDLAKQALLRPLRRRATKRSVAVLERRLLQTINRTRLGPMGLGGKTTALAVNILTHPTHIAGLPVCVNISCHALRSASVVLR